MHSSPQFGYLAGLAWTPDGKELLTWEISNNRQLYFVSRDDGSMTSSIVPVQFFETPQLTPDNEAVMFYGADAAATGLFRVARNGGQVALISDLVASPGSFVWSPDGNRLAYVEMDRDLGEARVVIQESRDARRTVIATLSIPKGSGSSLPQAANLGWAPDGSFLVFEFGRNSTDRAVYLAFADGSGHAVLAESAHAPAISADGRCLAFIRGNHILVLDLAGAVSASSGIASSPVRIGDLPPGRGRADFRLDRLQWQPIPAQDR